MKNYIILCIVLCVVSSLPADIYQTEWRKFKETYNKHYLTEDEDNARFKIFSGNLDKITEHNKEYELGSTSYKMSVNSFTDLTNEEYQKMLGYLPFADSEAQSSQVNYHEEWDKFKKQFGRVYSSQDDEFRYKIFCENLDIILKHNEDYKRGLTTFEMGVNNFSDMTTDEVKKYMGVHRLSSSSSGDLSEYCEVEWKKFKATYSRSFTVSEDKMRSEIFCNNLLEVDRHNEDFEKGLTTYEMTINKFSDRTPEEMKKMMGYKGKHLGILSTRVSRAVDGSCQREYEEFKESYNKFYNSEKEELKHQRIFCKNVEEIKQHNQQYDEGYTSFKMGINRFTDMTLEEIKRSLGFLGGEETLSVLVSSPEDIFQSEWQKFKKTFQKSYLTQEEEGHRYQIFCDNLEEIANHNEQYKRGLSTFKMAVNKFTDLTHEEFQKLLETGL